MIESVCSSSFHDFGELNSPWILEKMPGDEYEITESENEFTCYPSSCTFIMTLCGMPILAVSSDDMETIHWFYLEAPVLLKPGVWHSVQMAYDVSRANKICESDSVPLRRSSSKDELAPHLLQQISIGKLYGLTYQVRDKDYFFHNETHSHYELTYVDTGQLHSIAFGSDSALQPGEITLYFPGQWHAQYAGNNNPVCFVTIAFEMDYHLSDMLKNRIFSASTEMKRVLSQMMDEQTNKRFLCIEMIKNQLKTLLILLYRHAYDGDIKKTVSDIKDVHENTLISTILRYIADNLHLRLSVEKVAKSNNISISHMSSLFRKHLNMSPSSYIRRVKLNESKRIIREERLSIKNVASVLGYSTVQHFSRCFKSEFNMTPSDYANSIRGDDAHEPYRLRQLESLST